MEINWEKDIHVKTNFDESSSLPDYSRTAFKGVCDHCKDPRDNVRTHPFNRLTHDVG